MTTEANRRQFERLSLTERAFAVDAGGLALGPVRQVGGGGMLVCECLDARVAQLHVGEQMRLTIVEPDLGTTNVMDVEVRYITGNDIGMEFITLR
jgi:hypothetical protein